MAKKAFALRLDEAMLSALQRWADDEFRSINGQIEYLLHDALKKNGRLPAKADTEQASVSAVKQPKKQ
ncbi:Arc family DNA-binding protein [Rheinheimera fenheensis]|uniref:Arc family DNA-binding protein n=1 Tax=Rheinheimera fenheensis TaxID=3152295 RepID=UPI00325E6831